MKRAIRVSAYALILPIHMYYIAMTFWVFLNIFTLYGIRLAVTMHCERSSALSVRLSVNVFRSLVNR